MAKKRKKLNPAASVVGRGLRNTDPVIQQAARDVAKMPGYAKQVGGTAEAVLPGGRRMAATGAELSAPGREASRRTALPEARPGAAVVPKRPSVALSEQLSTVSTRPLPDMWTAPGQAVKPVPVKPTGQAAAIVRPLPKDVIKDANRLTKGVKGPQAQGMYDFITSKHKDYDISGLGSMYNLGLVAKHEARKVRKAEAKIEADRLKVEEAETVAEQKRVAASLMERHKAGLEAKDESWLIQVKQEADVALHEGRISAIPKEITTTYESIKRGRLPWKDKDGLSLTFTQREKVTVAIRERIFGAEATEKKGDTKTEQVLVPAIPAAVEHARFNKAGVSKDKSARLKHAKKVYNGYGKYAGLKKAYEQFKKTWGKDGYGLDDDELAKTWRVSLSGPKMGDLREMWDLADADAKREAEAKKDEAIRVEDEAIKAIQDQADEPGRFAKPITPEQAEAIMDEAGNDPERARQIARERGLAF